MFTTPSGTALFAFFFRGAARCSTALAILLSLGDRDGRQRQREKNDLALSLSFYSVSISVFPPCPISVSVFALLLGRRSGLLARHGAPGPFARARAGPCPLPAYRQGAPMAQAPGSAGIGIKLDVIGDITGEITP